MPTTLQSELDAIITEHQPPPPLSASPASARQRRKRKRRTVIGFGPRLVFLGAAAALAVVVLCAVFAKLLQPYQMQHRQAGHIRQLKAQLVSTQAENAELQDKIAALNRPDGVQTAARAQGYLLPGEVSLDITALQPPRPAQPKEQGIEGLWHRALRSLTGR